MLTLFYFHCFPKQIKSQNATNSFSPKQSSVNHSFQGKRPCGLKFKSPEIFSTFNLWKVLTSFHVPKEDREGFYIGRSATFEFWWEKVAVQKWRSETSSLNTFCNFWVFESDLNNSWKTKKICTLDVYYFCPWNCRTSITESIRTYSQNRNKTSSVYHKVSLDPITSSCISWSERITPLARNEDYRLGLSDDINILHRI